MVCINYQQVPVISYGQMNLQNDMRLLMTQLAHLSQSYMTSAFSGYGNSEAVARKLYGLPLKFMVKAELIFGPLGEELVNLLSLHVVHLKSMVNALIADDLAAAEYSAGQLCQNGNDISAYYSRINPFWDEDQWRSLQNTYCQTLVEAAYALKAEDFERELDIFDRLLFHALQMGDYLADGIIQYLTVSRRNASQRWGKSDFDLFRTLI